LTFADILEEFESGEVVGSLAVKRTIRTTWRAKRLRNGGHRANARVGSEVTYVLHAHAALRLGPRLHAGDAKILFV
jgi:hypothetical protein